eukprot:433304-Prymnesium_polylepis.2
MTAREEVRKRNEKSSNPTDAFYARYLSLRTQPLVVFLDHNVPDAELPISSVNKDRLFKELGLSGAERKLIEGLQIRRRQRFGALRWARRRLGSLRP